MSISTLIKDKSYYDHYQKLLVKLPRRFTNFFYLGARANHLLMPHNAFKINKLLLHDNDEDEAYFFEQALKSFDISIELICTSSFSQLQNSLAKLPDLIFLDINIPDKSGFECLKVVRSNPLLRKTPVVMYSNSNRSKEVQEAYKHGANLFIGKPTKIKNVEEALKAVFAIDWSDLETVTSKHALQNTILRFGQ